MPRAGSDQNSVPDATMRLRCAPRVACLKLTALAQALVLKAQVPWAHPGECPGNPPAYTIIIMFMCVVCVNVIHHTRV